MEIKLKVVETRSSIPGRIFKPGGKKTYEKDGYASRPSGITKTLYEK